MNTNILNIQLDKFTANIEPKFIFNLIERIIKKVESPKNLYKLVSKRYNLQRYNQKGISDNLRKWQKNKRCIYLDYYFAIGHYLNIKKSILYSKIKNFKIARSKNSLTKYPLILDHNLTLFSELIRVEGHLDNKRIIFENTNTELNRKLRDSIISIGVPKESIQELLHIKIQIPEHLEKSEIRIKNLITGKDITKFHERMLQLQKGNKKEIIFIENNPFYNKEIKYLIQLPKKKFHISIFVLEKEKIIFNSTLKDKRYKKGCASLVTIIHNKTFCFILNKYFKIQFGKKSRKIFIPNFIKQMDLDLLKNIVNATFAAESTICIKSPFVTICSLSPKYLKDFKEILEKFNITSKINKKYFTLKISCYRNFSKISKYFNFITKEKIDQFKLLLSKNFDKAPKGLAIVRYLKVLENLKVATMTQIRNKTNRTGNSFRIYINESLNKGYIKPITTSRPKKYSLTGKGEIFLKRNETYWLD